MCAGRLRGCKQGIYGLSSWDPPRQPHAATLADLGVSGKAPTGPDSASKPVPEERTLPKGLSRPKEMTSLPMIALYDYMGNKNTPLGYELSVRQREKLTYLGEHPENKMWILAENSEKDIGYVPNQYMHIYDDKPTSLPWLQNQEPETPSANGEGYTKYKSAYTKDQPANEEEDKLKYYCRVCEKQLNGPKPYASHMASRAHREELELLEDS